MNPTVRNKWVAALKSGRYAQNDGYALKDLEGRYDALGVLCDTVCKPEEWRLDHAQPCMQPSYYVGKGATSLPPLVAERAELNPHGSVVLAVIYMGQKGKPFSSIADFIDGVGGSDFPVTMYSKEQLHYALGLLS